MFLKILNIKNNKKGFTLFELLVVLSIVGMLSVVTFNNLPQMDSKLSLELLAQDIALTLRQAQVYGTTVFGTGATVLSYNSYGVSFPDPAYIEAYDSKGNYTYTLFVDIPSIDGIFFYPVFYLSEFQYSAKLF